MTSTPPTPPSRDFIRYDLLTQKALRGVVRDVLTRVSRDGVPGDHHFYVSFRTTDADVNVSHRLLEQYPAEMTIVLQHQFWDLEVDETGFSVGLSFKNVPERLGVPFSAITGFFDPSVQFGLKFDGDDSAAALSADETFADAEPATIEVLPVAPSVERPVDAPAQSGSAEVVSLDKFRKK